VDVVEIDGVAGDLWPARNVVDQDEVERAIAAALGRAGSHRHFEVGLSAGRTALLDQMHRFPILYDYDVEIAQGTFILDPVVVEIEEGVRLLLRGTPQDGGLAVSAVYQAAESLGVKERAMEFKGGVSREDSGGLVFLDGPKAVQGVDLLHRSAAFDSFLPDGKALVLASQADLSGAKRTQIVYLRRAGGDLPAHRAQRLADSSRTLVLVNSESLSVPAMGVDVYRANHHEPWISHPGIEARLTAAPALFLHDWLRYRFKVWRLLGPWAVVVTDPSWDADSAEALDGLLTGWKPRAATVGLDVTLRTEGGTARVPVRWSLPVRAGSDCGLMLGITSSALYDFDVEVAQFASAVDPVQMAIFDGLCLGISSSELGGGNWALDVQGSARVYAGGPPVTFDPRDSMLGTVDQPRHDSLLVDEERVVSPDHPLEVGGSTKEGERPILHLEIAVR
jgi:hypothetical protein